MTRILFLTQTPECGSAARYRVYQYLDYLKEGGIDCCVFPAVNEAILKSYLNNPNFLNKTNYYSSIILNRLFDLLKLPEYDIVFLQRDILVHIYPFIEKLIALRHKEIIFDFDDAIHLYPTGKKGGLLSRLLLDKKKVERIIKMSKNVIVANNFLKDYVLKFSDDVTVIPTSIDTRRYNFKKEQRELSYETVRIGWMGSQGTFCYLETILPILEDLARKYKIELEVIGAKGNNERALKINYKDWDINSEINDIENFDIGIMPLVEDEWSRGKSATKLLQYMAAGVPAVASGVGVNYEIVKDGVNGFLANNKDAWINKISILIEDRRLRSEISKRARLDIERFYSTEVNAPKLLDVIRKCCKS